MISHSRGGRGLFIDWRMGNTHGFVFESPLHGWLSWQLYRQRPPGVSPAARGKSSHREPLGLNVKRSLRAIGYPKNGGTKQTKQAGSSRNHKHQPPHAYINTCVAVLRNVTNGRPFLSPRLTSNLDAVLATSPLKQSGRVINHRCLKGRGACLSYAVDDEQDAGKYAGAALKCMATERRPPQCRVGGPSRLGGPSKAIS